MVEADKETDAQCVQSGRHDRAISEAFSVGGFFGAGRIRIVVPRWGGRRRVSRGALPARIEDSTR
jgi:hypothetical protein